MSRRAVYHSLYFQVLVGIRSRGDSGHGVSGARGRSFTRGSIEAENAASATTFSSADSCPEYRQASWNYPYEYLNGDQRHKARVRGSYELPLTPALGRFNFSVGFRF